MAKKYSLESPSLKVLMFDYLRFYNSIENIKADKDIVAQYPQIKLKVSSILKQKNLGTLGTKQIIAFDKNHIGSNSFIYTGKSKIVNLLRHIRNSIAHGNLIVHPDDNNIIIVKDYSDKEKKNPTCYGHISIAKFKKLLKVKDF